VALAHFEVGKGVINGLNRVFTVSLPYIGGTTAVFYNGQLKRRDYNDGWSETDPISGVVTLDIAPLIGDVVQVFYVDALPPAPGTQIIHPLLGRLEPVDDLCAIVLDSDSILGWLFPEDPR
jgi:hypothetical protein